MPSVSIPFNQLCGLQVSVPLDPTSLSGTPFQYTNTSNRVTRLPLLNGWSSLLDTPPILAYSFHIINRRVKCRRLYQHRDRRRWPWATCYPLHCFSKCQCTYQPFGGYWSGFVLLPCIPPKSSWYLPNHNRWLVSVGCIIVEHASKFTGQLCQYFEYTLIGTPVSGHTQPINWYLVTGISFTPTCRQFLVVWK